MHMVHYLMRNPSIILQDIVVLDVLRERNLLGHGEHFRELVVRDVVQFRAVVFGDDELFACQRAGINVLEEVGSTEWPFESGPMSRKASVFSLSKIFIDGISPGSQC